MVFKAWVADDSQVTRVVVLYRALSSAAWLKVELAYDSATHWAMGRITVEMETPQMHIYLPLVLRGN